MNIKHHTAWIAEFMLLLVAIVWGASYGLAKTAVAFYPVFGFLAVRFCSASILLAPSWFKLSKKQIKMLLMRGIPLGLILLSIFVSETYGVSLTYTSHAAFLISLSVVFTPVIEWIILKSRPNHIVFVATGISVVGAWLLTSQANIVISFNLGDSLILVAALLRAVMVTCTNKLIKGKNIPSLALTAIQTGTVGIGCFLLGFLVLKDGLPHLPENLLFWYATGFLVFFCTLFAFFAQNYALQQTTPTRVTLLMATEPVFGGLFAAYWLHESITWVGWMGGLLIVIASILALLKPDMKIMFLPQSTPVKEEIQ